MTETDKSYIQRNVSVISPYVWHVSILCVTHEWIIFFFVTRMSQSNVSVSLRHVWLSHFSRMFLRVCDMSVRRFSVCMCVTHEWIICLTEIFPRMYDMSVSVSQLYRYVPWRSHAWYDSLRICDMTHSYMTWRIHVWHDSFTRDIRDMSHSYVTWRSHVTYDSFICDPHSHYMWVTYKWVTYNICHIYLIYMWPTRSLYVGHI